MAFRYYHIHLVICRVIYTPGGCNIKTSFRPCNTNGVCFTMVFTAVVIYTPGGCNIKPHSVLFFLSFFTVVFPVVFPVEIYTPGGCIRGGAGAGGPAVLRLVVLHHKLLQRFPPLGPVGSQPPCQSQIRSKSTPTSEESEIASLRCDVYTSSICFGVMYVYM